MTESHNTGVLPEKASDDTAGVGSKRKLIIAGAAAFALLVTGGGFLLLSGGEDDAGSAVVAAAPRKAPAAKATAPDAPVVVALPPPASVKTGKNPFKALVLPVDANAEADAAAATTASTTATGSTAKPADLSTTTSGSTTSTPAAAPVATPAPLALYDLTLLSITGVGDTRLAHWKVDGKPVDTISGQRFGKYQGELMQLGISPDNGYITIQVGDAAPINVAVGATVQVM